ncbi:hypothetical protein HOY82DRAFT_605458 [Tuber indicum]|nr:hypothetical protein HOY82DRAFT_605458 [Tuber indicum]
MTITENTLYISHSTHMILQWIHTLSNQIDQRTNDHCRYIKEELNKIGEMLLSLMTNFSSFRRISERLAINFSRWKIN